jgi:hypothetical protein
VLVVPLLSIIGAPPAKAAVANPVIEENRLPGSSGWRIPTAGNTIGDDAGGQIKGYASATSVNRGEGITFMVSVSPAQTFTVDIYRLGWYGGAGGRLVRSIGPVNGVQQPTCPSDSRTGMVECHWSKSLSLDVPVDWVSGLYVGVLTNAQHFQNYVVFTVRDDSRASDLLFQQTVTTYQAYNNYPNFKSLYEYNSTGPATIAESPRAVKVSFDRPYKDSGSGDLFVWEANFVGWMERMGYDVSYATDVDTHANPSRLLDHKGLLSVGHDEYWSKEMFDAWETARDQGRNLGFFGANAAYWQVRFEPSSSGVADRVMVCYKSTLLDPVKGSTATDLFRLVGRPEQRLVGVQYSAHFDKTYPFVVQNAGNWVYAGSGFRDGDTVEGLVGAESDRFYPLYQSAPGTSQTLLSSSPVLSASGLWDVANASVYQAPSGAWVFGAATQQWSWGLSDVPSHGINVDSRIQRTTQNVLDRLRQSNRLPDAPQPTGTQALPGTDAGYLVLGSDGRVFAFGEAKRLGDHHLRRGRRAVRLVHTPDRGGYWIADDAGKVATFGNASNLGSLRAGTLHRHESVTSLSATRSGRGYWLFTTEGRVFSFGDAPFYGDMAHTRLKGAVLGAASTATGLGYYMVGADGGVFAFGDASFFGSMSGKSSNAPFRSMALTSSGRGYWLLAADGGVFAFGDAPFLGSMSGTPLNKPMARIVRFGNGYFTVAADGGVFNFSNRPFLGSLGARPPRNSIVAAAA